jgi:hypothetical protein
MADVQRIAAAYPAEAQHTPRWEREAYLTEAQQLAWLLRFDPAAAAEALSASASQSEQKLLGDQPWVRTIPHRIDNHG